MKLIISDTEKEVWNKGKLIGQKPPLKPEQVWAIRIRLEMQSRFRDLAMFNLAIDSKLRGCDLIRIRVRDVCHGFEVLRRTQVVQQKTNRPVQFELTEKTRCAIGRWLDHANLKSIDYLFPTRVNPSSHICPKQYHNIVKKWISSIGLDATAYGTHSLRRTKVAQLYKQTHNLRAIQILLGHSSLESTVRYLGVEIDDALILAENLEM